MLWDTIQTPNPLKLVSQSLMLWLHICNHVLCFLKHRNSVKSQSLCPPLISFCFIAEHICQFPVHPAVAQLCWHPVQLSMLCWYRNGSGSGSTTRADRWIYYLHFLQYRWLSGKQSFTWKLVSKEGRQIEFCCRYVSKQNSCHIEMHWALWSNTLL